MTNRRKGPNRRQDIFKLWGNSVLFINAKFWSCSYCGKLLKDKIPFSIVMINGNPAPYILCSALCLRLQTMKIEASHTDRK